MKRVLSGLFLSGAILTAAAQAATMIEVKPGESLWQISQKWLGTGERWPEVHQANKKNVPNPDQIEKGQRLKLPAKIAAHPVNQRPTNPLVKPSAAGPIKIKPSHQPKPKPTPTPTPEPTPVPTPMPSTLDGTPFMVDFKSLSGPPDPWCEPP